MSAEAHFADQLEPTAREHFIAWRGTGSMKELGEAIMADSTVLKCQAVSEQLAGLKTAAQQGDVDADVELRAFLSALKAPLQELEQQRIELEQQRIASLTRLLPPGWTITPPVPPPKRVPRGRKPTYDAQSVTLLERNFARLRGLLDQVPLALKRRRRETKEQFVTRVAEDIGQELYRTLRRPLGAGNKPLLNPEAAEQIVTRAIRRRIRRNDLLYGLLGHWLGQSSGAIRGLLER